MVHRLTYACDFTDQNAMLYDQDQDGYLTDHATIDFADPDTFKDDEALKAKVKYVYEYGMKMCFGGVLDEAELKEAVLERIAARVGMDGKKLDEWLGM